MPPPSRAATRIREILRREAVRRGCSVADLSELRAEMDELALVALAEGVEAERARQPAPRGSWADDDEITEPYPREVRRRLGM